MTIVLWALAGLTADDGFDEKLAATRGRAALVGKSHVRLKWTHQGFDELWKAAGLKTKPTDYPAWVFDRYGLPPAPYVNGDLPMGLRAVGDRKHVTLDCLLCHGGPLLGESVVGQPNAFADLTALFADLNDASRLTKLPPLIAVNRARGVTNAGALGVLFVAFRNSDLSTRPLPLALGWNNFADLDAPAWWLLKKKRTMYCDGGTSADSTRSMMQFMLAPGRDAKELFAAEDTWRDIHAYIRTLEPPKYPFPIDAAKAARGQALFEHRCAECHGTYGAGGHYPNRIVPLAEIGTDPHRYHDVTDAARKHYNSTWFGAVHPAVKTVGYQAPPLDGVWATAPYFHNGSVPTVYHVLNSKARPHVYRRNADPRAYDGQRVGMPFDRVEKLPRSASAAEKRRFFDASRVGAGVGGHTFGDSLDDQDRYAIVEYLKTL